MQGCTTACVLYNKHADYMQDCTTVNYNKQDDHMQDCSTVYYTIDMLITCRIALL